jgi:cytosine/adenosine deaminase-related metal-dependent hydrolase
VHGVGLGERGVAAAVDAGAAIVWCPASNEFLLGAQPDVAAFLPDRVALGTDARLTGSRDLLDEIGCAARTGALGPLDLLDAVTASGRRLTGASAANPGSLPDLAVLQIEPAGIASVESGHLVHADETALAAALLSSATRADLELVVSRGRPVLAAPHLESVFLAAAEPALRVRLDGSPKLVAESVVRPWLDAGISEPGLDIP